MNEALPAWAWLSEAGYPFRHHWHSLPAGRLHYVDEGTGPPLVLVHGNPTWSFAFRKLVTGLSSQYRVIVPDHLGCGLSDKPQRYAYRLAQHGANLAQLIAALDLRDVTLICHDWGGPVGLSAARRSPERYARYGLMNTGAFRCDSIPFAISLCRIPGLGALMVRGFNGFVNAALRSTMTHPENLSPLEQRAYAAPYDSYANRIAVHRFVQDIPMFPDHPSYAELVAVEEFLSTVARQPTLLAWGLRDWCFDESFLQRFQERLPQAEVRRFEQAGHYLFEDVSTELVRTIHDFVSRTSRV